MKNSFSTPEPVTSKADCACQGHCCCQAKFKKILLVLGVVLFFSVILVSLLREKLVSSNNYQVTIAGQGKVLLNPDTVEIVLGVTVNNVATGAEALSNLNTAIQKVMASLKSLEIPEKDIQTMAYKLYPEYAYNPETEEYGDISGYSADQIITITVTDLSPQKDLVNKIIAETATAGANRVDGVSFNSSKLEELKQKARILAIQDAQKKSQATAKATGVKLGKITSWYENLIQSPDLNRVSYDGMGGFGGSNEGAAPRITTGKEEIIIEVNVNYEIK